MYTSVISTLNSNSDTVASLPALSNAFENFKSVVTEVETKNKEYLEATAGKTAAKDKEEDEVIEKTVTLASVVNAYANINNNEELKTLTKISYSYLKEMRDSDMLQKLKSFYETIQKYAADLADFGVTEDDITVLNTKIEEYIDSLENKESSLSERAAARKALSDLFSKATSILRDQMDKIVEIFYERDKDFYNSYQSARVIKDLGV
jgi:hypothetical protein